MTPDRGISFEAPSGPRGSVASLWRRAGVFGYRVHPRAATAADPADGESSAKAKPRYLRASVGGPDPSLTPLRFESSSSRPFRNRALHRSRGPARLARAAPPWRVDTHRTISKKFLEARCTEGVREPS